LSPYISTEKASFMIDVSAVLQSIPHFDTLCSVEKIHALVESLRTDPEFEVMVAGTSANGVPIHHVRFGKGTVKALVVACPHAHEPIGSMSAFALMSLLQQRNPQLTQIDVEWNIVPCIDPDAQLLNEPWSQFTFSLERYARHFYTAKGLEMIDTSFPLNYGSLNVSQIMKEGAILRKILDAIKPDYYLSLHNSLYGGLWCLISRDIGQKYYKQVQRLAEELDYPVTKSAPAYEGFLTQYSDGFTALVSMRALLDYAGKTTPSPEKLWPLTGDTSHGYLAQIKPEALTFVPELGYLRHPDEESLEGTGQNLRKFKLRIEADSKYLATIILQEWDNVKHEVDTSSPFFRTITGDGRIFPTRENLLEGGVPITHGSVTGDILLNPLFDRDMTRHDRFLACMMDGGFFFVLHGLHLLRLLKSSQQTPNICRAIERIEGAVSEELESIKKHVDFEAFEVFPCDKLAKAQLGSGLIGLNSILDARAG
jgi:hypothetical protein